MSRAPAQSTFSPYWYRIENLRPSLREHVRVRCHRYRGVRWYVFQDPASGRHHRVSTAAHRLIARLDGRRTLGEIWERALEELGDSAPSQSDTIALLAQLHAADLLRCEVSPDARELLERHTHVRRKGALERLMNPLYIRIPLFDPDAWLERALPWVRPLCGRMGISIWLIVVSIGVALALSHRSEIAETGLEHALDPRHLPLLALAYVGVKLIHELGHALTAKLGGGEVHELGLVLIAFFPSPYVDASSASAFPDKRWRMAVGAAGVAVELFLSALALLVFCSVAPGWQKTLAYDVVLISGLSTLIFNGNPLLRFDGYYVLADALEIPNLAGRARERLAALFSHHVLGLPERRLASGDAAERRWLVAYGLLSFAYRMFITLALAVLLARRFQWLGVLVALWGIGFLALLPAARALAGLRADPRVADRALRVGGSLAGLAAGIAVLFFAIPLPLTTRCDGVVWLPENAQVRAGAEGFVIRVVAATGSTVRAGQLLIETRDPEADAKLAVLEARLREVEQRADQLRRDHLVQAEIADDERLALEAELARARELQAQSRVLAPSDGRFVLPRARDLPGRFVRRGQVLGYVAGEFDPIVRTIVSQDEIALVRGHVRQIGVRLVEKPGVTWQARVEREIPAASQQLPSLALGAAGGGRVAVDVRDQAGLTSVAKFFQLDLAMPQAAHTGRIGARAYVRFEHKWEPVFARVVRSVRRLFLRELRV